MQLQFVYRDLGNNGRLGNCLFQTATTLAIAKRFNVIAKFPEWKYAKYFKKPLNQTIQPDEITHHYPEPYFHYTEIDPNGENVFLLKHDNEKKVINLHGYFQSERYWNDCKDLIIEQFEFEPTLKYRSLELIKNIKQTNGNKELVSVHFRFGDYTNNPYYAQLTKVNYYQLAFKYCGNNFLFVVFSDDKNSADNFMRSVNMVNYIIISTNSEIEDFSLMSMCEHNIIANSSFSWWASYLNKNNNKRIIAPKDWFGEQAGLVTSDIYREEMIIL